jgi:hypothetical protein
MRELSRIKDVSRRRLAQSNRPISLKVTAKKGKGFDSSLLLLFKTNNRRSETNNGNKEDEARKSISEFSVSCRLP